MVTELFRSWPLVAAVGPVVGRAGVIAWRPFTGDADEGFPCCWPPDAEEPTTTGGRFDPAALNGVAMGFLAAPAAEAYDVVEGALGFCAGVWSWFAVEVIRTLGRPSQRDLGVRVGRSSWSWGSSCPGGKSGRQAERQNPGLSSSKQRESGGRAWSARPKLAIRPAGEERSVLAAVAREQKAVPNGRGWG